MSPSGSLHAASASTEKQIGNDDVRMLSSDRAPRPGYPELRVDAPLPAQLGRYVVLEQIGKGGMGRVLRAYDPKLRREVALKLLVHTDALGSARMVREAQAMARLSHPSIVPVYDVDI